jgi:hypothetical protein
VIGPLKRSFPFGLTKYTTLGKDPIDNLREGLAMAYATYLDLKQVEPTIDEYGVLDWDIELERSEIEINRVLKVRWYQSYQKAHPKIINVDFNPALLDGSQFTQATIYHALAYHISPKLTQFSGAEPDRFQVMMDYYRGRFEHEMDLILREGVRYDLDDDGQVESNEQRPVNQLRLVR